MKKLILEFTALTAIFLIAYHLNLVIDKIEKITGIMKSSQE